MDSNETSGMCFWCQTARGIQIRVWAMVAAKAGTSSSRGSPCIADATAPRTAK
ncbi:MAG: hypothetical protein CM1200mP32_02360 [Methanobacteriota archaeon]|nr:MAG: hypothetical protein CM1200mP32_02360 [Euryarchaeota archaeon]